MHIRSTVAATLLLAGSPFVQARYDYSSGETDAVKAESAKADSSYGDDYSMSAGADSSTTGVSQAQGAASWSDSDKTNGGSVKADSNYGDSYDGSSYGDDYSMGAEPPATVAAAGADSSTTDVSQAEGAASWSGSRETDGDSVKADSNYGDSYDGSSYGDDYSMSAEPSATAAGAGAGSATTDVSQTEGAAPLSGSDGTNTDSVKADSGYGDWSDDDDDDSMSIEPSATAAAAGADSSATDVSEAEGAAPSSGSDGTTVHVVSVGDKDGGLIFSPADIKAAAGDVVQFQFWPKVALPELRPHHRSDLMLISHLQNHSVVQSTFDEPCEPIAKNSNVTGFFSGFMPVSPDDTTMPTYTIPINDTKPIWFYCSQGKGKHCQGSMVGVINAYVLSCLGRRRSLFRC